jgi:hypothetical protein
MNQGTKGYCLPKKTRVEYLAKIVPLTIFKIFKSVEFLTVFASINVSHLAPAPCFFSI